MVGFAEKKLNYLTQNKAVAENRVFCHLVALIKIKKDVGTTLLETAKPSLT